MPPFAPVLMESTRALGYSVGSAIADLLDNSISADATKISIGFPPSGELYLSILDNGRGMTSDELNTAMRYGSKSPLSIRGENDLGRFGLGLKTASLSQCRCLTVLSKKAGKISCRRWDLDVVAERQDWVLLILEKEEYEQLIDFEELNNMESGTIVIWNELDRFGAGETNMEVAMSEKMAEVRQHLSLVFHRYLSGERGLKKVDILLNKDFIKPQDPFLSSKSTFYQDDENLKINDKVVSVSSFILPHISKLSKADIDSLGGTEGLRKYQGFYIYRNKRLLVWGTWFRMRRKDELSKLARVMVDIPNSLDNLWTLDIRKSTAVPPEIIRKNLVRIVSKLAEGSRRTYTCRGKIETSGKIVHTWQRSTGRDGVVSYKLNRYHPMVGAVNSRLDIDTKKYFEQMLQNVENDLPLNALHVDLANDEIFAADESKEIEEQVAEMANSLLNNSDLTIDQKKQLYETLKLTDPFYRHVEILERVAKECFK